MAVNSSSNSIFLVKSKGTSPLREGSLFGLGFRFDSGSLLSALRGAGSRCFYRVLFLLIFSIFLATPPGAAQALQENESKLESEAPDEASLVVDLTSSGSGWSKPAQAPNVDSIPAGQKISRKSTEDMGVVLPPNPEGDNGFSDELVSLDSAQDIETHHTFFEKGAATDFFRDEVKLREPSKVHILNSKKQAEIGELLSAAKSETAAMRASLKGKKADPKDSGTQAESKEESIDNPPKSPQDIVKKFGNPDQEPRVTAEENSPDSYKGLLAALEVGDDALAYKYARQYVRYQRNLQERIKKLTELSQIALERDGLVPEQEQSEDPNYERAKRIADAIEGNSNRIKLGPDTRRVQLDKQTQDLLKFAQSEEEKNIFKEDNSSFLGGDIGNQAGKDSMSRGTQTFDLVKPKSLAEIRSEIAARVRPDPQGKVLVQYFFRPSDKSNAEMIKKVAEIAWMYRDVPRVGFVAFTIDRMSKLELESISGQYPAVLPVRSGSDLAEKLEIKRSPAIVVIAASTGEAHILQGKQDKQYLEEFIKRVHGREK